MPFGPVAGRAQLVLAVPAPRELCRELAARSDVELAIDLCQVPFDGLRADVQLAGDREVRATVRDEIGDAALDVSERAGAGWASANERQLRMRFLFPDRRAGCVECSHRGFECVACCSFLAAPALRRAEGEENAAAMDGIRREAVIDRESTAERCKRAGQVALGVEERPGGVPHPGAGH